MNKLNAKEKYFVSCFVEKCNHLLHPTIGKTISLYTFLDGTYETHEEQRQQIKLQDTLLSKILFDISNRVDDERFYKRKLKQLKDKGFSTSSHFLSAIRTVSEWLWLVESDKIRSRVRNDFKSKYENIQRNKNSFVWPRSADKNEYFKNNKKITTVPSEKEKIPDYEIERTENPFSFDLAKKNIESNLLSSLQILQILDRASILGLESDQIIFLQNEYNKAIDIVKASDRSIYVVDHQGSVKFEKENIANYSRILESDEAKFNTLPRQKQPFLRSPLISPKPQPPIVKPSSVTQNHKPTIGMQKIFYDHFFCWRCSTPFEVPKDKQQIYCPCCGLQISR